MKKSKDTLIISITTIILLEIVLRLLGYTPYIFESYSVTASPSSYIIPHEQLGFGLNPGRFDIQINKEVKYITTHNSDSLRITNDTNSIILDSSLIHFYGCSFTYGMGVNDEETFSYLLQEKLKNYKIINKGVPGFGTIQSYLQLKNDLDKDKPKIVVLFYASFHDGRNTLSKSWRENIYYGFSRMGDKTVYSHKANFPYVELKNSHSLISYENINSIYSPPPLREYSSISNTFHNVIHKEHSLDFTTSATIALIHKMNKLCQKNNIRFVLASIIKDDKTENVLSKLNKEGIETLNMGIDILNKPDFNNSPYDSHPNKKAHKIYSDKLMDFLL